MKINWIYTNSSVPSKIENFILFCNAKYIYSIDIADQYNANCRYIINIIQYINTLLFKIKVTFLSA